MKPLQEIGSKSVQLFTLLQMAALPISEICNYLNSIYGEKFKDPIKYDYTFIVDKVALLLIEMGILALIQRWKKPAVLYITILALAFGFFELYNALRPKYVSYLIFVYYFSYTKTLSVFSGLKTWLIVVIHIATYIYHIARIVIQEHNDPSFPFFFSIMLVTNFIVLDIPYLRCLTCYYHLTNSQELILNDFKCILDTLPNPIIVVKNNQIELMNKMAVTIFPIQDATELLAITNVISKKYIPSVSYKGKILSLKSVMLNTFAFGQSTSIISVVDNTELVETEKNAASENAKWLFINSTSHQIRTPLSGIESSLHMLEKSIQETDTPSINKYINTTLLSVSNLRHIVDDSMFLCEDMDNSIAVHNSAFHIEDITKELFRLFNFETYGKQIKFEMDNHTYEFKIVGDKKLLLHMLYTLLMNAFKFTSKGNIKLDHSIVENHSKKSKLTFIVSDTGIGMNDQEQSQLFHIFSNSQMKRDKQQTSTGIGMYIARKLSILMKGGISFSSSVGHGTTFKIWVKVEIQKNSLLGSLPNLSNLVKSDATKKVLVVDDNNTNVYILTSMLSKLSVICDKAYNGVEAVNKYNNGFYNLVLMDINMPEMNGYEASALINKKASELKQRVWIIAVSAQNEPVREDYSKCGIVEWVEKPLRFEKLEYLLSKYN
jgi:signal transduction histidine kinase/CheY-like chemotaxis protein